MSTETVTEPKTSDAPPCWPPVAHIHDKRKGPLREGKRALCGEKLMGIDLPEGTKVCETCLDIFKREIGA